MYLIESRRNGEWIYDPGIAMALQDYVQNHIFLDDDILFPYMIHPTVQIGKFQNAYEEVNQPYMDKHDIKIVRRETGGGAIYLDDWNMNFSFLFNGDTDIYANFSRLYEPAVKALNKLGVEGVEQQGRNDLVLGGKKVSGAAMTVVQGRVYAGFSMLLDPNYEAMVAVLNPNQKKIESHGIKSIRSRVGSIRPHLASAHREMTVWDFAEYMMCQLLGVENSSEAKRYELTSDDWQAVEKIAVEKYNNWDWNYGRFHQFDYELTERFSIGTVRIGVTVKHAKVAAIQITGDFFGTKDVKDVEMALMGTRLKKDDLLKALEQLDLVNYFGSLTKEEFVSFIVSYQE